MGEWMGHILRLLQILLLATKWRVLEALEFILNRSQFVV
jgi:hypothetical protein